MAESVNDGRKIDEMKLRFHEALKKVNVNANSALMPAAKYTELVQEVKDVKKSGKKTPRHFWLTKHYDVIEVRGAEKLIAPMSEAGIVQNFAIDVRYTYLCACDEGLLCNRWFGMFAKQVLL